MGLKSSSKDFLVTLEVTEKSWHSPASPTKPESFRERAHKSSIPPPNLTVFGLNLLRIPQRVQIHTSASEISNLPVLQVSCRSDSFLLLKSSELPKHFAL